MKFILNEAEKLKILNLLDVIETNSDISEFYNNYLKYKIECEPNALDIYQTILECNELDGDEEGFVETIEPYKLKNIKQLPYDEFSNNEYLKNIKFPQIKLKNLTFEYDTYLKGEAFISEDITFDNEYRDINQLSFFDKEIKFPYIKQSNRIWMSVVPHEINTMKSAIDEVKGNVLVYGLGLGYFPYMISNKQNVKSITIIEKNKDIIDIFQKYILNQFPNKNKIKVIQSDAFNFQKSQRANGYDFAFVDLWRTAIDGLSLYIKMRKLEVYHKDTKYLYWIENSLISSLRRAIAILISEELSGSDDSKYSKSFNTFDSIINSLHFILKNVNISSYNDVYKVLSTDFIKKITTKINL